jgi:23S rRNA C2498 (ribose-2'-O)-methylase RlmM
MGVIVTESIELGVGLSVDSYYISLDGNDIRIQRIQQRHEEVLKSTFQIETSFTSWISKEAKDAGNRSIGRRRISVDLDAAPTGNIYELLYNQLKKGLTNYVDA